MTRDIKKHRRIYNAKKCAAYIILLLPAIMAVIPVILVVSCSFVPETIVEAHFGGLFDASKKWNLISADEFLTHLTLEQYKVLLLQSPEFLYRLWHSFALTIPVVVFQLLFSSMAAYCFSQTKRRWLSAVLYMYLLLLLLPQQVTVIPNYLMVSLLNLTDTDWAIWLPGIASPFSAFLLTRYMQMVPDEILQAAKLDGAGEWGLYRRIMIPLCKGGIVVCAILVFADYWNMVELPVIMFSGPLYYPLSVYLSKIEKEAIGIAFAADVLYMIPALLVFRFGEEELQVQGAGIKK